MLLHQGKRLPSQMRPGLSMRHCSHGPGPPRRLACRVTGPRSRRRSCRRHPPPDLAPSGQATKASMLRCDGSPPFLPGSLLLSGWLVGAADAPIALLPSCCRQDAGSAWQLKSMARNSRAGCPGKHDIKTKDTSQDWGCHLGKTGAIFCRSAVSLRIWQLMPPACRASSLRAQRRG